MKKIAKWFFVFSMCLELCIPTWADDVYSRASNLFFGWSISASDKYVDMMLNDCGLDLSGKYYFASRDLNGEGHWTHLYVSDFPFILDTSSVDNSVLVSSSSDASFWEYHFSDVYKKTEFYGTKPSVKIYEASGRSRVIVVSSNFFDDGDSDNNSYAYDSNIPAPQNLKLDFLETKVGILGLSRRTDLQLSWSNALVDDYSVQISANITTEYTPGEGNQTHGKKTFTHKLVGLSQVDSGGADAGYPASSGKYTITEDELLELAKKEIDKDYSIVERAYVNSFRVQFYKIDSGVINVGPIGVVNLSYSFLGKYQGSTTTTEYPNDSSDIGEGGLMPDDSGKWSGDGSGWEYDEDGNISGSTDGSKPVSWSDALKNLLNGLVNIPTVIASMFESLTSLMSGIGQFPAFFSQVVSWLPPEIASLIGLGIMIVIALRIFGR